MTQVSILSGIYADSGVDFRVSMPRNLVPVPGSNGIANGYLRTAEGLIRVDSGSSGIDGIGRGGINWNGVCYRVIGSKFCSVAQNGTITVLGDVGAGTPVSMDYSFDRLAIASNKNLFYWDGGSLKQVTDQNLGHVLDVLWMDGYFVTTDGANIVVTELNDPFAVDPLKYGSSEADPDPIVALLKTREELFALNRYTIEVFDNVGGDLFPFTRNPGAMIQKGCVGTHTCCLVDQFFAFLGGGRNEQCSVYLGASGQATKIATREIEDTIAKYTEGQLALATVEYRAHRGHQHIYVKLPEETLVYDVAASNVLEFPTWFVLSSSTDTFGPYRAQNFVFCYDQWLCDDMYDARVGRLTDEVSTHYGDVTGWRFDTVLIYNEGRGAIINSVELVGLPGRAAIGKDPKMFVSWTDDGLTWSDEKLVSIGKTGQRGKRMQRRGLGRFRDYRGLRFRGANDALVAFSRLESNLEALAS